MTARHKSEYPEPRVRRTGGGEKIPPKCCKNGATQKRTPEGNDRPSALRLLKMLLDPCERPRLDRRRRCRQALEERDQLAPPRRPALHQQLHVSTRSRARRANREHRPKNAVIPGWSEEPDLRCAIAH